MNELGPLAKTATPEPESEQNRKKKEGERFDRYHHPPILHPLLQPAAPAVYTHTKHTWYSNRIECIELGGKSIKYKRFYLALCRQFVGIFICHLMDDIPAFEAIFHSFEKQESWLIS